MDLTFLFAEEAAGNVLNRFYDCVDLFFADVSQALISSLEQTLSDSGGNALAILSYKVLVEHD